MLVTRPLKIYLFIFKEITPIKVPKVIKIIFWEKFKTFFLVNKNLKKSKQAQSLLRHKTHL